jgi:hypothetical protein
MGYPAFWDPGFVSYAMVPKCRPNVTSFFSTVLAIVHGVALWDVKAKCHRIMLVRRAVYCNYMSVYFE